MRLRPLLALAFALTGFVGGVAFQARPADPEARVPRRYRLAALIERQQRETAGLRRQVEDLRVRVDGLVRSGASREEGSVRQRAELDRAMLVAGLVPLRGPGLRVTLDDSDLEEAPSGNVNDLVIHSQDVQAVVNALWRAGAEAISINGQRLVGTSAVLCVGNTLLLNGTVHSPPYVVSAIGASRDRFDADPLVERLRSDAERFGIRVGVSRIDALELPAFKGVTTLQYARVIS